MQSQTNLLFECGGPRKIEQPINLNLSRDFVGGQAGRQAGRQTHSVTDREIEKQRDRERERAGNKNPE